MIRLYFCTPYDTDFIFPIGWNKWFFKYVCKNHNNDDGVSDPFNEVSYSLALRILGINIVYEIY